ncbi:3562_t:CDS:2 [Racocetra persica]|uniref:3562_t:CDS:1 n=1 Tax=Racocetra persica TaxID=160502 RepID=A0ACA9L0M9_9GLOM|nr:3562_t:CDS:2 [Racocetra persica]
MVLLHTWLETSKNDFINYKELKRAARDSNAIVKKTCYHLKSDSKSKVIRYDLEDFYDEDISENEINVILFSKHHENILKAFYCATTDDEFYLLVEYADQGDLECYLKNNAPDWTQRLKFATQLASGLNFLHSQEIVHLDLNPKNIFIHENTSKLTNFGAITVFFKPNDEIDEIVPYIEPRELKRRTEQKNDSQSCIQRLNINQMSNIYSFGVLLWRISSSRQPYVNIPRCDVVTQVIKGLREDIIPKTPVKYYELYQNCWDDDPDKRPDCSKALTILETIDINEITDTRENAISYHTMGDDYQFYGDHEIETETETLIMQESDKKLLLDHWKLCRGLNLHEDTNNLTSSERDLIDDNEIRFMKFKKKVCIKIYTNNSQASQLKSMSLISSTKIKEISIQLHIPLLQIEYGSKVTDEFAEKIEDALRIAEQESDCKVLFGSLKEYGEFIAQRIEIGGALMVEYNSRLQDIEMLKAHVYWAYDQVMSGKPKIFDQVKFDNFTMTGANDNQKITSDHELKDWMKTFYEYNKGYVISYNKIIPACRLLNNEIKQKLRKVLEKFHDDKTRQFLEKFNDPFIREYIPNMGEQFKKCDINDWIPCLQKIHLCDWVNNLRLRHGLTIKPSRIGRGTDVAINFTRIPESRSLKAITLKNRIKFNDNKIPFLSDNFHPIFDDRPNSEVFCFIVSEKIELIIKLDNIESSEILKGKVYEAIDNDFPFNSLKRVFDKFGHLWSQKIILGWTASRSYNSISENELKNDELSFDMKHIDDKFIMQPKIIEKLREWRNLNERLDTSFFMDSNGKIVKDSDIYLQLRNFSDLRNKYLDTQEEKKLYKLHSQLQIVRCEGLVPLYKVLSKDIQKTVEDIMSDSYRIVMTGVVEIKRENQTYVNIKFVKPLQDNDFEMFGNLVTDNMQGISDVMIRFSLANQYGCRALIHKPKTKSIPVGAKVYWIMLAKGRGYFSKHTRDIKINRKELLSGHLSLPHKITISKDELPDSCIFITSFDSENIDKNQVIQSKIISSSETGFDLEISMYGAKSKQRNELNNVTMRWCIIDINQACDLKTDIGNNLKVLENVDKFENFAYANEANRAERDEHEAFSVAEIVSQYVPIVGTRETHPWHG